MDIQKRIPKFVLEDGRALQKGEPFIQQLLRGCYVLSTFLGARETIVNKTKENLPSWRLHSSQGSQTTKLI